MFTRIVRRNLIALMIPVIITELLILYMTMQLSLLDEYRCYEISDISNVDIFYREGEQNVSFNFSEMIYDAGFDQVNEDKVEGAYYYSFYGKNIQLFVLTDETAEKLKSGKKTKIAARLIKNDATISYIKNAYTEATGLGEDVYEDFINPIIISEPDFPIMKVKAVEIVQITVIICLIISVLYTIIAFIKPVLFFGFSKKGLFKTRKDLIDTMNNEIENRLDHKEGLLYITEGYIIKANISHIVIFENSYESVSDIDDMDDKDNMDEAGRVNDNADSVNESDQKQESGKDNKPDDVRSDVLADDLEDILDRYK